MKIVISGGAGLIGAYLTERLVQEGHTITVIDRFSAGKDGFFKILSKKYRNLSVVKTDLSNQSKADKIFSGKQDWVFHLAGIMTTAESIKNPLSYHRINLNGTLYMLEAARKKGVNKFIYAASSTCYGDAGIIPTPESSPIVLENPYALTKHLAEQYVLHWAKVYKINCAVLRLFSIYGSSKTEKNDFGPVFRIFINQYLKGEPLTVNGDGRQSRDFLFVTDAVDAFIKAAKSDINNEVFNVGSGKSITLNYIAETLNAKVKYDKSIEVGVRKTCADISKIRKKLKWKPKISIEEGIRMMLKRSRNQES
jgi:UDP-glucose 4-epimerase